jgi:hypothetical protein
MLAIAVLQFLGLTALGLLIGILVTPFVLYAARIIAYALASNIVLIRATLRSKPVREVFPKVTEEPVPTADGSKPKIYPPNYIHSTRGCRVSREDIYMKPIPNLDDKYRYENRYNQLHTDILKQPITKRLNTISTVLHGVLLFYKNFYGHSTKVEKNRWDLL